MYSSNRVLRVALLIAVLAVPLWATLDRDGDGISDIWTALYPGAGAPAADPDGDGQDNRAEALAGTAPDSPTSHFAATPARDVAGNLILRWTGLAGKHYKIESTYDLRNWLVLSGEHLGTGADLSVIVRPATDTSGRMEFWRVAVSDHDSDNDELNDWEEAQLGTNPGDADTDHDGMPEVWEVTHGLSPVLADANDDPDQDGFTNAEEFAAGMNPTRPPLANSSGAVALCVFQPCR